MWKHSESCQGYESVVVTLGHQLYLSSDPGSITTWSTLSPAFVSHSRWRKYHQGFSHFHKWAMSTNCLVKGIVFYFAKAHVLQRIPRAFAVFLSLWWSQVWLNYKPGLLVLIGRYNLISIPTPILGFLV